ncbi:hypothetical protein L6452_33202 [Arctium lappa]|uniref:Uncharacterized protein n=1 Tax=Arctium lappa TaxID=4217 RepID=A0ACB8Z5U2_ARCLA|nr:hypothetical protein L6452_33202 [Arctium lappa]
MYGVIIMTEKILVQHQKANCFQVDTSSVIADVCLNDLDANKLELRYGFGSLDARARALKGLIELISGNRDSCTYLK